ncbi:MAG: sodium transporter [Isosphaeraceae bacterium]
MISAESLQRQWPTLLALIAFTLISLGIGVVANLVGRKDAGFLRKYFLGNRSMGAITVALTAAVMSGGTFLGFPSLVYTFGWVVGLWICSYMIAPLTYLGLMGKRVGQLARKTGALTLPDLFRERFGSPSLGLATSLIILVFLTVFMEAQFVAGAKIIKVVLTGESLSQIAKAEDVGDEAAARPSGEAPKVELTEEARKQAEQQAYWIALAIFTLTVVAYTAYGGFLAAVWTDVFQSLIMAAGVIILLPLAMAACGGLSHATLEGVGKLGTGYAFGPGAGRAFHPLTMAFSYFVMWAITGAGQPSTLVRLMAFRDSRTLRYSIIYVTIYNAIIYIPLILIFIAARTILPDLKDSDSVMPMMVVKLANPYVAGIIMAAPYGAVLSTVSGWLLIIASGLVHDLYQRFIRPQATEKEIARASYLATVLVGLFVALMASSQPAFLQLLVVFSSTGLASAFLVPGLMTCFWRRATSAGALSAMILGPAVTLALYALGIPWVAESLGLPPNPEFGPAKGMRPYYLLGFDPCVWGISASILAGVVVSLFTRPPDAARVSLLFDLQPPDAPAPATLELHPERASEVIARVEPEPTA